MQAPIHSSQHLPALDGLRGIAILLVMAFHRVLLHPGSLERSLLGRLGLCGWVGVDLFFVLSGFLITGILFDTKDRPDYFRRFYFRRTVRIFPLYYGFLLGVLGLGVALQATGRSPFGWGDFWRNQLVLWTYTTNLAFAAAGEWYALAPMLTLTSLWSLAIEEQFYLVWPLLIRRVSRRVGIGICLALVPACLVARWAALKAGGAAGLDLHVHPVPRRRAGRRRGSSPRTPAAVARPDQDPPNLGDRPCARRVGTCGGIPP
jgi:peptidoglycan/LPS O-acetylase OafA/YrhL